MGSSVMSPELGRRQTAAGTVVDGVRQPELTLEEREAIVDANNGDVPDEATKAALARQGGAGIGGEPELTEEERSLIAAWNQRKR